MTERLFLTEFAERADEVREYIALLKIMQRRVGKNANSSRRRIERGFALARASAFLILYNAIESSAREAVAAVYEEIGKKSVSFDDLRISLRKRIISDTKNNFSNDNTNRMQNIAFEIVTMSFDPEKLFSGNVDARELKKIGERLGIDLSDSDYSKTAHGQKLVEIKNHRNDLAHGDKSFVEVGRGYTTTDIGEIIVLCLSYMEYVLRKVDEYLENEGFREQSA